jgi:hypothetical protein
MTEAACFPHSPSSIPSDHERRTAWGWLASFNNQFIASRQRRHSLTGTSSDHV